MLEELGILKVPQGSLLIHRVLFLLAGTPWFLEVPFWFLVCWSSWLAPRGSLRFPLGPSCVAPSRWPPLAYRDSLLVPRVLVLIASTLGSSRFPLDSSCIGLPRRPPLVPRGSPLVPRVLAGPPWFLELLTCFLVCWSSSLAPLGSSRFLPGSSCVGHSRQPESRRLSLGSSRVGPPAIHTRFLEVPQPWFLMCWSS